jgi:hypothetical protein
MPLEPACPRCPAEVTAEADGWRCPVHAGITPLWRPAVPDYESLAQHLVQAGDMPTFSPWPLSPGWTVTDFGSVWAPDTGGRASLVTCAGPSDLDGGVVEVTVVSEEPGVGLGARCAKLVRTDPGPDIGDRPADAKVRIAGHPIPLWSVLSDDPDLGTAEVDRFVLAGEAEGRWLWLVLRPASAALLLNDEWLLVDLADHGPDLIDLPFGGVPPAL